jgi:hypothetical protein
VAILVDTGVVLSAVDADDRDNGIALAALGRHVGELLVPSTVVAEASWQIESYHGPLAEAVFLESILAGELTLVELVEVDYRRATALIRQYADLGLGLVDASIVAIAERLQIATLATFNHRDFRVVRPAHCDALELIP